MSLQTPFTTRFDLLSVPFVVSPSLDGELLTIVISGELDIATGPALDEAQRSVHGSYKALRYELAGLDFIDSAGLRALLAPVDSDVAIGAISISDPSRAVRRLLELRGLQWMITD